MCMNKDMDLVEDAEERPLVRQKKANSLSSSFKESPKEVADNNTPLKFSSIGDQNTICPSLPHEVFHKCI